ncbi:serine protease [Bosea sp. 685]|uniref:S1 family peptidase n=1 Tax=Bosea sp. 685 TaxID=3080057 RepID=UPI00289302E1|nr:serine protease [Bosea sp. 685]WNJ91678.1 serine protease [Bosea sp. 685]
MANAIRTRFGRAVGLGLALAAPAFALLPSMALAQAPAPAPNPQLAAAQASFDALPEAERKAIQTDLIWAGLFSAAVSGSYGPLTFRAINALKAGRGEPNGVLSPAERTALAQTARSAREAAGFRLIDDERTGMRIGIPEKVLPKREATPTGGSRWQSADGKITLDATTNPPGETLDSIFEKATLVNPNNPGRKITYKLLRPDFFVVTGETATGKFYRRLASGPQGLRGFSIGYDKTLSASVDKLVIAIAGSFEPFPTGPAPASPASAIASVAGASSPIVRPAAPPTERYGVGLVISDKVVATAASAIDSCRSLRVGGRPARLRAKDDASGLALLDLDGGPALTALGSRSEALGERENLVLVAFGDDAGKRAALALPGQAVRIGANAAVFAPLQPGQAGSPVFDRQGRLAGLVTANPSDKILIAGVAPQRAYAVADAAALQAVITKAGLSLPAAAAGGELSTGRIVEKVGKSVLPVVCGL